MKGQLDHCEIGWKDGMKGEWQHGWGDGGDDDGGGLWMKDDSNHARRHSMLEHSLNLRIHRRR